MPVVKNALTFPCRARGLKVHLDEEVKKELAQVRATAWFHMLYA
jgi:hypothetical protein